MRNDMILIALAIFISGCATSTSFVNRDQQRSYRKLISLADANAESIATQLGDQVGSGVLVAADADGNFRFVGVGPSPVDVFSEKETNAACTSKTSYMFFFHPSTPIPARQISCGELSANARVKSELVATQEALLKELRLIRYQQAMIDQLSTSFATMRDGQLKIEHQTKTSSAAVAESNRLALEAMAAINAKLADIEVQLKRF